MTTETIQRTAETAVRETVDDMLGAVRSLDLERIMSHYDRNVRAFDAIAKHQFRGIDAYREHWQACLGMCQGPMTFEAHEVEVTAGDDIAFCHYLINCGGTNEKGETESGWMRASICFRRKGDKWLIVHEHHSAPFDMESGKALMNLEP